MTEAKERAVEAFWILNDFIGDLVTAVRASEYFDSPKFKAGASEKVLRRCNKMAGSFLFLTLAKWIEFYDHYKFLIPEEIRGKCKQLRNELERRGVRNFRNEVVGHIWSDKHDRPLMPKEIEELGKAITNGDEMAFLRWINDPSHNHLGETVVGMSEAVRDLIKEKWALSESDVLRYRE